jgi:hypothetical protein
MPRSWRHQGLGRLRIPACAVWRLLSNTARGQLTVHDRAVVRTLTISKVTAAPERSSRVLAMKKPSPSPAGSPSLIWPAAPGAARGDVGFAEGVEHIERDAGPSSLMVSAPHAPTTWRRSRRAAREVDRVLDQVAQAVDDARLALAHGLQGGLAVDAAPAPH